MTGKALGDRQTAGLGDDQIRNVHIVLDVVDKKQQLGAVARTDLVDAFVELFDQLAVSAGDDDHLQIFVGGCQVFIDLQNTGYAKGACHQQNSGFVGAETLAAHDLFFDAGLAELFKGRDAQRINDRFIHAVFLHQLVRHLRLGEHIGVDAGRDIGAVGVKVGDQRDRFDIFQISLGFELGDHRSDKGVAHDDHVGVVLLDDFEQLVCLCGVDLHHGFVRQIFAVGHIVHLAVKARCVLYQKIITLHRGGVIHLADGTQSVHHRDLDLRVKTVDRVLQCGCGSLVTAAGGRGKNQKFHNALLPKAEIYSIPNSIIQRK